MDRVVFVVGNAGKQLMLAQAVNANNLANANTNGFQAEMAKFSSRVVGGAGFHSRVFAVAGNNSASFEKGEIQRTGRTLDVAVNGNGWIAVQAPDGKEAYTRAGNLHVNINGQLLTRADYPVLGDAGPIVIPDNQKLEIGSDGTISVRPLGQQPNTLAEVGRIKMVSPDKEELEKGPDGLLRMRDGRDAPASTDVSLVSGALESSNVNGVEAMVNMISLARMFDVSVKIMSTAKEMDERTTQIMSMG
ncbi:MAG: flagellar basal body rod protein FlgF [Thiogranum sp.]